jgi:activator of HSP90 ATPase
LRELDRIDAEPAVLNRFEIEQQGTSVRVVDADGSVYEGVVEEPVVAEFDSELRETFEEKKDQLAREKLVALQSAIAPRTEDYSFRVSGSNVTLRQMVVVNGRFATGTNASARRAPAAIAGNLSSLSRSAPTSTSKTGISNRTNGGPRPVFGGKYGVTTNQPATIEGTVRIGVTNQQWFRAVRDPR